MISFGKINRWVQLCNVHPYFTSFADDRITQKIMHANISFLGGSFSFSRWIFYMRIVYIVVCRLSLTSYTYSFDVLFITDDWLSKHLMRCKKLKTKLSMMIHVISFMKSFEMPMRAGNFRFPSVTWTLSFGEHET